MVQGVKLFFISSVDITEIHFKGHMKHVKCSGTQTRSSWASVQLHTPRHQNSDISPLPSGSVLSFFSWAWALFVKYTEQFTMNCLAVLQRILN
jgi:hypothetical protein